MSKQARVPPGKGTQGATPSKSQDVTSNSIAKGAFEDLIKSVKVLASDQLMSRILEHFDDIPKLEAEIKSKDEQIRNLGSEKEQETAKHKMTHHESLSTYDAARDKLKMQLQGTEKRVKGLTDDMKQKDVVIETLKKEQASLEATMRELKEASKVQEAKIKKASASNTGLAQSLKASEESNGELKKALQTQGNRLSQTDADLKRKSDEFEHLRREHRLTERQLREVHSYFVTLHNEEPETVLSKLEKPWSAILELILSAFFLDLSDIALQNETAWHCLKHPRHWRHSVPLPQSNTLAAKQMRSALILASVIRAIDFHIFQPTLPITGIREVMTLQAQDDSQKEAAFRALLQALLPKQQDTAATRRVAQMCEEVMQDVAGLLPAGRAVTFKEQLTDIAEELRDVWQEVQRLRLAVEPKFTLQYYSDWDWHQLRFDGRDPTIIEETQSTNSGNDEAKFAIFPRFYVSEEDGTYPVTHGVVFMKSQTAAAAQELEHQPSSPGFGRGDSILTGLRRPRKPSTAIKDDGGETAPQNFLDSRPLDTSSDGRRNG